MTHKRVLRFYICLLSITLNYNGYYIYESWRNNILKLFSEKQAVSSSKKYEALATSTTSSSSKAIEHEMLRQDWTIECKAPNELLNQFKGVMRDLRNTKCYYGLVELAHSRKMVTKKIPTHTYWQTSQLFNHWYYYIIVYYVRRVHYR